MMKSHTALETLPCAREFLHRRSVRTVERSRAEMNGRWPTRASTRQALLEWRCCRVGAGRRIALLTAMHRFIVVHPSFRVSSASSRLNP